LNDDDGEVTSISEIGEFYGNYVSAKWTRIVEYSNIQVKPNCN